MAISSFPLPFEEADSVEGRIDARDRAGRARAVDPHFNVALEASAGTGKTRVLVDRYINLLHAGVDPGNILAITFTRKAAAEMRERILSTLRASAARGELTPTRWRELRDRTSDINISTIDAFCLSLLREFPLEADLDPGFSLADETEVPRLIAESLDRALRICRSLAREDEHVALVFAQLGDRRARKGLAALLNRRIVAPRVLARFLATGPRDLTVSGVARRAAATLIATFDATAGGLDRFLETGPLEPAFLVLASGLRRLRAAGDDEGSIDPAAIQAIFARAREHFLTQDGSPRTRCRYAKPAFASVADWHVHKDLVVGHADAMLRIFDAYRRDLNVLVSRGISRMFAVAEAEYRRTLEAHAVLDFSDVLLRALALLRQMEEFSRSRYRLESRYHHVLVDEFQDTSRAQWELISLLVQAWGEGAGLTASGPLTPSIFIVGDRKQSIYGFRDADGSLLSEASRHLEMLRPDGDVRRSISRSFRSVPALLTFVNDVCHDIEKAPERRDGFRYAEEDRFPIAQLPTPNSAPPNAANSGLGVGVVGDWELSEPSLGLVMAETPEACAEIAGDEIARLVAAGTPIRDRDTGVRRPVRPGDIAILFRTRDSHREFESALEQRGIPAFVYKGLGFFDSDEIKDVLALLWYLADPWSDLRTAALMRSRFIHLSDEALRLLAPRLSDALRATEPPAARVLLDAADSTALGRARVATARWRSLVDRTPPAELLDLILNESAYVLEMHGPRFAQARENLKKMRALVRRIQNRGYATLGRIAAHLDRLAVGDEANAVIDASDAVNLMTVHASKGLEFPVVFLVNLARGTGSHRDPIRIAARDAEDDLSVAVGDYQSEADEDDAAKQREETKRLLYVALTRARDRLYLGSALKEGRIQPGRGSLAEVLPQSLLGRCAARAAATDVVEWQASSGQVHRLAIARTEARGAGLSGSPGGPAGLTPQANTIPTDFTPLVDTGIPRHAIAALLGDDGVLPGGRESDRLVGTFVHRLLERFGLDPGTAVDRAAASRLRRHEEMDGPWLDEAMDAYRAILQRGEIRALYLAGARVHEAPFTMRVDGSIVRGTIDCLVRTAPDRMTLLEFKTGRPRPEHRTQLDLYRRAAESAFPGSTIDARLVYAGDVPTS
ncbi:MAG: hypothetical protein EXQ48_00795 [Acidobacteria bacterium]|nr:hypothetical protein [Acidobacteriota bacterium]